MTIESKILNLTEDLPTFDGAGLHIGIVSARWNSVVCVGQPATDTDPVVVDWEWGTERKGCVAT